MRRFIRGLDRGLRRIKQDGVDSRTVFPFGYTHMLFFR